uniref:Cnidarian restricted protein n=1 Tax=Clytia hemisphaerica TaxID=252671 RepID=A0A7M5UYM4_9CNID
MSNLMLAMTGLMMNLMRMSLMSNLMPTMTGLMNDDLDSDGDRDGVNVELDDDNNKSFGEIGLPGTMSFLEGLFGRSFSAALFVTSCIPARCCTVTSFKQDVCFF